MTLNRSLTEAIYIDIRPKLLTGGSSQTLPKVVFYLGEGRGGAYNMAHILVFLKMQNHRQHLNIRKYSIIYDSLVTKNWNI